MQDSTMIEAGRLRYQKPQPEMSAPQIIVVTNTFRNPNLQ